MWYSYVWPPLKRFAKSVAQVMGGMMDDSTNNDTPDAEVHPFVSALFKWLVGSFLIALCSFAPKWWEAAEREQERQREQRKIYEDMRESVRRGEGGEASNRLFAEERDEFVQSRREQKTKEPGHQPPKKPSEHGPR